MFRFPSRLAALFAPCLLLLGPPALPQQTNQSPPDIRISVDRVDVGVIVTDSKGQFIGGLRREDFRLFDDGTEQSITDFLSIDEPAQVLVLIEAGPAVYLIEASHLRALSALLNGLSPNDRVAIARYNEAPEPILNFTTDKVAVAATLGQLGFNLGFGQLNLASSLSTALDWLAQVPGKKSLVLLSTGIDTSPPAAAQNLLARLKSTDVRVLAISLGGELRGSVAPDKKRAKKDQPTPEKTRATAEGFARADEELKSIASTNGGRVYFPASTQEFAEVFAEIAQLVRHEYSLGFVPPAHDGKLHTIDIRITGPGSAPDSSDRIDHRPAYIAPQ